MPTPETAPSPVPFADALRFWLKLGFISFGGPAGQIAVMHAELVERKRWISEKRFLHALNYCMVLPGPEAQQLATYIGWLMHRTWGGIVAGALFVLPSLMILVALAWAYLAFGDVPAVAGLFYGIKPAVTAIVLHAAWRIGGRALGHPALWALAALAFAAIFFLDVPFPAIVAGAALAGFAAGRWRPGWIGGVAGHGPAKVHAGGRAWIDDDTPTPPHARFRWPRLLAIGAVGLALWVLPMAGLAAASGAHGTLVQMGWFFTKAALLTFGGAYAVLPYVYQGGVEDHGWLSAEQMIDGLALGETTPGPLIMVVAFVGYVGGHGAADLQAVFGGNGFVAGAVAAGVVTWFTFLPSFLFILAGGPLVEATHGDLKFTAPLRAITAAIVGVILNLALFFAWHVLWPDGGGGRFDVVAAALAVAAGIALFRFRRGVVETILACGLLGLVLQFAAPRWLPPVGGTAKTGVEAQQPAGAGGHEARLDPAPGMLVIESRYFRVASTATPEQTHHVLAAADALHDAWESVMDRPHTVAPEKMWLRLYGNRREFQAHNRSQPWAEAYYLGGVSYAYVPDRGRNRVHWMLHEVTHQLNRERGGWRLPRWANEGVATYFSTSRFDGPHLLPGQVDPDAYPAFWLDEFAPSGDLAADVDAGRFIPLAAILTGDGAPPLARSVNQHYVHWWSLAHYLFTGDDGKHADGFRALLHTAGTREDFERLIGPLAEIERGWYAHLRTLADAHPGRR